MTNTEKKNNLIILTGPTAVGKTALSLKLANDVGGEIVSADSIQVYKHFDIGSAKILPEEMQGIPHHLIDILEPKDSFNVMEQEPNWNLLYKKDVVEQLPHINNYFTLLNQLPKIDSVDKLAMFIAIIRPAKKYLISEVTNNGWDSIIDKIWIKEDTGYMYKKSHAVAYALSITVAMSKFI